MERANTSVVLAERPVGNIVPGKTFAKKVQPAPTEADLKDGQILAETLYLSLDPAMRGWLNDTRSYVPPVQIGEVMRSGGLVRVLASKSPKAKAGDVVFGFSGWQEVCIMNDSGPGAFDAPFDLPASGRLTDLLGVLGMTGLTAYFGVTKIANIKPGETVVVSGAAGATGSVVGQMAKNIFGARVVGLAGGADKCRWLKEELGFDEAIDYKAADFKERFAEATPKFIDVYWDNVGGEILDMCLKRANKYARFVMCGAISQYNSTEVKGIRNLSMVITMSIRMEGFIVLNYPTEIPKARQELAGWLADGKIKRQETVVKGGLDKVEQALVDLFNGANTGKMLVEVKGAEGSAKL
ncbi:NADP-dependent leukotriene B4 12-hydroxydehydrogenase [Magnaporthiopsis poae ATCC 64411]|uniref:Dehydrogenase FUB6 n=1 Tax=Magnaporthiopsis poae (strain ATCC 64411 / 73-15) TaxID=644358 RepID=A0A0C4EA62_MAGP6|nr:NADP-dependent leukotriene B4 12-hydroxydehydrogenase [Magnaporthiopsis poae ATCC 64411]